MHRIEPWGDEWMQTSTVCEANRSMWAKGSFKRDRYIPRQVRQRRDPRELEIEMQYWATQHNAGIAGKKGAS